MSSPRYFIPDFIEIQRKSFFNLLKKGIIEEFSKRNPITSLKKDVELLFYPEYYKLTTPEYSPRQAIIYSKSYTSKLYIPVQLTYKKSNLTRLKWAYVGNIPIMTKRGHFILNGAARVIVNQIIRSPGIYYQQKLYETFSQKWSQKAETSYKRYYADLICLRGTWLRIEIDKDKNIWAQTKKGPKIPVFWFLIGMGLSERIIFNSVLEPNRLVQNLGEKYEKKIKFNYVKNPPSAWKEIFLLLQKKKESSGAKQDIQTYCEQGRKWLYSKFMNPRSYDLGKQGRSAFNKKLGLKIDEKQLTLTPSDLLYATDYLIKVERGLKNLDDIDHLKNRRVRTSGELIQIQIGVALVRLEKVIREKLNKTSIQFFASSSELRISPPAWSPPTMQPRLSISELPEPSILSEWSTPELTTFKSTLNHPYPSKGEYVEGINGKSNFSSYSSSDRALESSALNETDSFNVFQTEGKVLAYPKIVELNEIKNIKENIYMIDTDNSDSSSMVASGHGDVVKQNMLAESSNNFSGQQKIIQTKLQNLSKNKKFLKESKVQTLTISNLINNKAFNSAIREFFGTSPLSQFMDQINPLAEITHKRRLSSMGPGGVTRDTATLAIRGIHPTHYGRICPIETPEGKNTGLVNSMTAYARVNDQGMLESPFYKVYKGIVLKNSGMYFLSAEHEEKTKLAAADLFVTPLGFLPNTNIPVRIAENFTKINRNSVEYIGVSPTQMISIATSLIPFLEHDDANRALMGSNMQRQAVPLIRPERPIVGTGLEPRAVSDSGHVIQAKFSGVVTYVSAAKIIVTTLKK